MLFKTATSIWCKDTCVACVCSYALFFSLPLFSLMEHKSPWSLFAQNLSTRNHTEHILYQSKEHFRNMHNCKCSNCILTHLLTQAQKYRRLGQRHDSLGFVNLCVHLITGQARSAQFFISKVRELSLGSTEFVVKLENSQVTLNLYLILQQCCLKGTISSYV